MLLKYLAKSSVKIRERHDAKQKTDLLLSRIRKISTKKVQHEIDALEISIKEALTQERQIIRTQKRHEDFHNDLITKVSRLQKSLDKYIDHKSKRESAVRRLEAKMAKHANKTDKSELLTDVLHSLEDEYHREVRSGKHSKKELSVISNKIKSLKLKLKKLS